MKSNKRQNQKNSKRQRKAISMQKSGGQSQYARKKAYLNSHGGWGFDYDEPKPWKS